MLNSKKHAYIKYHRHQIWLVFGFIINLWLYWAVTTNFFPINNPSVISAEDPDLVHAKPVIYPSYTASQLFCPQHDTQACIYATFHLTFFFFLSTTFSSGQFHLFTQWMTRHLCAKHCSTSRNTRVNHNIAPHKKEKQSQDEVMESIHYAESNKVQN